LVKKTIHAKSCWKKTYLSHDFEFNLLDKTFACDWRNAPFECFSRVKIHFFWLHRLDGESHKRVFFFFFCPISQKNPMDFFNIVVMSDEDNKRTMLPLVPLIIQLFVQCLLLLNVNCYISPMWIIDFVIVMPN
jgi:hypothetical protein